MNKTQPFLHISFVSICFQSYLKASDIEFEASLNNLIISHEKYPRILSSFEDNINSKLVSIQFQQIPSPRYDEIKNHVQLHFNKFLFELKLEVFLSIIKFLDNFFKQWSTEFVTDKTTVNHSENIVDRTTMEIQADLQEFRVIISTVNNPMFDVHVQGVKGKIEQRSNRTNIDLVLNNFCLFDSNIDAKYREVEILIENRQT